MKIDTSKAKQCFKLKSTSVGADISSINFFEDVMKSGKHPTLGKTIFFHETSCSTNNLVHLNARQACAIESAALLNPNWDVFVMFASPVGCVLNETTARPPIISALESYANINFRNINLWTYAANTPLEHWFLSDKLFFSEYLNSHVSDFLRYVSLYKFGGLYLDLDVIVQKTIENMNANYAGAESENFVAAGVINFEHDGIGHEIADMCVREFYENFRYNDWGFNGPGVITRTLKKICHVDEPLKMSPQKCLGFKVYAPNTFYAVPWPKWDLFFDVDKLNQTIEMTKNSIAIHVWNKHSSKRRLKVGTKAAYGLIAEKNCPKVYVSSGEYF
ncbi:lactosylceramide 4-alpha-galactosyltransferase-like [Contarinia nasturtii]|uniref:lactosylceramide 4-alpha-galactosyltransferase-like n=1 Tax=Contarinia nasturtii TaxID=265458 RepID=UPI0012D41799|nr:lactosylceramide 4-alpha-galactosyltransferase-like [Contarinia nasturtii]